MKWALMVDRGKRKGMIIPVQKTPFLIGRNDECQLRAANPYVSHRHCELLTEDDKIAVRDCKSTNGTFINSQRVEGQVELHEGDCLKVGSLAFLVCHEDLKPIEEPHPERSSPKQSRPVDEEAVGDILLKLDEEDTGQPGPGPGAWRNTSAEGASSQPGPAKGQKAEKSGPDNEPANLPSDVARGLLKGQGALLKRRRIQT
jgi:pSer/pThr/pTyr-binding forkhead associated (FHA) protein